MLDRPASRISRHILPANSVDDDVAPVLNFSYQREENRGIGRRALPRRARRLLEKDLQSRGIEVLDQMLGQRLRKLISQEDKTMGRRRLGAGGLWEDLPGTRG